jgi:hypothetical protein
MNFEYLFNELWETPKDKLTWYTILNKAKEMYKQETCKENLQDEKTLSEKYQEYKDWLNEITELSDEEIEEASEFYKYKINKTFFIEGAKWYREQLKNK